MNIDLTFVQGRIQLFNPAVRRLVSIYLLASSIYMVCSVQNTSSTRAQAFVAVLLGSTARLKLKSDVVMPTEK